MVISRRERGLQLEKGMWEWGSSAGDVCNMQMRTTHKGIAHAVPAGVRLVHCGESHKDSISGTCADPWAVCRCLVDPDRSLWGRNCNSWALGLFSCDDRTVAPALPHELCLVLAVTPCLQTLGLVSKSDQL